MIKTVFVAAAVVALATLSDATTVSVLEIGKGGVARRTTSTSPTISEDGIEAFWRSMHDVGSGKQSRRRRAATQYPGMSVVPDLFNSPDGGIAIGITGSSVDLASMPNVASILDGTSAIGHFSVKGNNKCESLMKKNGSGIVSSSDFESAAKEKARAAVTKNGNKLESMVVRVENDESAAEVDASLGMMLKFLEKHAEESGSTVIVHIVVDEEEGSSRRRLMSRELSEDDNKDEEDRDRDGEGQGEKGNAYGYYNSNGQWVTTYRTMFQIQYFNIVLWTAVGLTVVVSVTTGMMMYMPLMPDTLLFGESAKMVAE